MERGHNSHHIFYERRWYTTPLLKTLRGLVIVREVDIPTHNQLHAETRPPLVPQHALAANMVDMLQSKRAEGLDAAFYVNDYLMQVASAESIQIADNIQTQLGYLV